MSKKAYLIKGSIMDFEGRKEWIESITTSKGRASKIKDDLNHTLISEIENSKEIFDKYLKEDSDLEWGKMEFHIENMTEDEFYQFCIYRYGTKMPFRIEEVNLS